MKFSKSEVLVVFALKPESQGRPEKLGFKTIYTGVGKVNACVKLMDFLLRTDEGKKVKWVINMGSAGSQSLPQGSMVFGKEIKQHDMDVRPLGFDLGVTPFDESPQAYESFSYSNVFESFEKGLILTGDRFVTEKLPWKSDAIDMEAYALAKACHSLGLKFTALKYITDGADGNSEKDWPEEVKKAALGFEELLKNIESKLQQI
jgi:adenosylhomocysteine nucleosidase